MQLSTQTSISREELINLHDIFYKQGGNFSKKYSEPCLDILTEIYQGRKIQLFDHEFSAIVFALKSFGVTAMDEVIVSSHINATFLLAITTLGAIPKPIITSYSSPKFQTTQLQKFISPKTKAIVLDYIHGVMPELDEIIYLTAQKGIFLLEYASDGLGASYKYNPICSFGHIGIIGFNNFNSPINLGCALIRNDSSIPWAFSEDNLKKCEIELSELKSAILLPHLRETDTLKETRKDIWMIYLQFLQILEDENRFKILGSSEMDSHNFSGLSLIFEEPTIGNELHTYLSENQVETNIQSNNSECFLDLPFHPNLTEEEILRITLYVNEFFGHNDPTDSFLELRRNFLEDFDL